MLRSIVLVLVFGAASGCVPTPIQQVVRPDAASRPVPVSGIPAEAAEATRVLNGTITTRVRAVLPPGAIVVVRIEDVSLADAASDIVAEQTIRPTTGLPVVFALPYAPASIDVGHRYGVRATVRDAAGALLWTTTTHTPVFTQGAPVDGVQVVVERVATGG